MKRGIAQLLFGQAQVIGATVGVYFLITTGAGRMTIAAVVVTGVISITSRVLFRVLWKAPPPPQPVAEEKMTKVKGLKSFVEF